MTQRCGIAGLPGPATPLKIVRRVAVLSARLPPRRAAPLRWIFVRGS